MGPNRGVLKESDLRRRIARIARAAFLSVTLGVWRASLAARMKTILFACIASIALGLNVAQAEEAKQPEAAKPDTKDGTPPVTTTEVAVIKTSEGTMVLEFWPDVAPGHVKNFKDLAAKGFYDGTCFHRVIKGFMIQGGDPLTKDEANKGRWGTGGPGHQVNAEFNNKPHVRGVLSMARSSDPNSAGSQFFICHAAAPSLDGKYTAFGKLIKGDDVLEKIATTQTGPRDVPVKRMAVESIKIVPADSVK
jgi:peptidyl-prolyl cis-trans isomerase B (cyclophilin B)